MVELRSKTPPIADQELKGFVPSLTMRPHHFFNPVVRNALRRRNSQEIKLLNGKVSWVNPFAPPLNSKYFPFPVDQRNYFKDVIGKTDASRKKFQVATEDYLTRLWKLPDESFIQLDLQPDGICRACRGGKHCTAIYVRGEKMDLFNGERLKLSGIALKLKDAGYKLGEDFIHKSTSSTLYDYDHRSLGTRKPVVPEIFVFDSLIVRTGALRRI